MSKIIEIAEKYNRGEIKENDKSYQEASRALAALASTYEGRNELAEIVSIALQDEYNKFDISPLIFDKKHFNYGEKPTFKTHKKGIKAYWTAPNSYVPKSQNYDTEITMTFEGLGVRPECSLSDLKNGRIDALASLIKDGREAIEIAIYEKVYTILAQVYNSTESSAGYKNFKSTSELTQAELDTAIRTVRKKTGGNPTIIADYDLACKIESMKGFVPCDEDKAEIRQHGELGLYRGCSVVYLPEIQDPVTHKSIVPVDKMFIVGKKIGYAADYGDQDFMQESDINDKSWNCRIDKEVGYVVTKPEGIYVLQDLSVTV